MGTCLDLEERKAIAREIISSILTWATHFKSRFSLINKNKNYLFHMCVCVSECINVYQVSTEAWGGQKKVLDALDLEL